jgi:BirA family biotin operon repressor/biotin-[acetyl-CoA-carboxylase] ligase
VAERQTAGRGRQGRAWHAAPGDSLTFSLALPLAPLAWGGLSLAVGLALAEALEPDPPAAGPRLLLKWPNDLWLADASVGGRKLGGVLIETVALPAAASARARWCVVGVGLNLAPPPEVPGGAGLREWQAGLTPARVLGRVAPALLRALRAFESAGFAPLRAAFARRDGLAGRAVYTSAPAGRVSLQGVSEGVADDGRLWLRDAAGTRHAVDSGEVSVRLQSSPGAA